SVPVADLSAPGSSADRRGGPGAESSPLSGGRSRVRLRNVVKFVRPFGLVRVKISDVASHMGNPLCAGQMLVTTARLRCHLATSIHFVPEDLERPGHGAKLVRIFVGRYLAIQ